MTRYYFIASLLLTSLALSGCDGLLGSKQDQTASEIFDAGRSEPGFISEAEYVPLFPFFTRGADGLVFDDPTDAYAGFDEFLYVTDARGLHVLDLSGRPALYYPVPGGATSVVQDRRLDLYVTARRDTTLGGRSWNLPVVYHLSGLSTGAPRVADIIWHPFDDDSRRFNRPDPIATDEQVAFTGVAVLPDNSIYVSRKGPVNDRTSVILPHNTVLEFTPSGVNVQAIVALHPTRESLRSALYPTDVMTFVQPEQRSFYPAEKHLLVAQGPSLDESTVGAPIRYSVLSIRAIETFDGIEYRPDTDMLQISANPERGDRFLYTDFRFERPTDMAMALDGSNYLFVTDSGKDSLFVFTGQGIEGVAPPPGARSSIPVIVSFGGFGDGSTQFKDPQGVTYLKRIVYVADTGNGRISRFRLNTDFE